MLPLPPPEPDWVHIESTVDNWTVGIPLRYSEAFDEPKWVDYRFRLSIKPSEHWRDAFARAIAQGNDRHINAKDPDFYCFFIDR